MLSWWIFFSVIKKKIIFLTWTEHQQLGVCHCWDPTVRQFLWGASCKGFLCWNLKQKLNETVFACDSNLPVKAIFSVQAYHPFALNTSDSAYKSHPVYHFQYTESWLQTPEMCLFTLLLWSGAASLCIRFLLRQKKTRQMSRGNDCSWAATGNATSSINQRSLSRHANMQWAHSVHVCVHTMLCVWQQKKHRRTMWLHTHSNHGE